MYCPYFRGKRFELLALIEAKQLLADHHARFSPIIEPVQADTKSLARATKALCESNVNFSLIVNPKVGGLQSKPREIREFLNENLSDYENFQIGGIISGNKDIEIIRDVISRLRVKSKKICLIHWGEVEKPDQLPNVFAGYDVVSNVLFYDKLPRRYDRSFAGLSNCVSLEDNLESVEKNADFEKTPCELFSREHLHFKRENLMGFSDFLTIGEPYAESGFLPRAVVIHITSVNSAGEVLINHFVSDSNLDTADVAGKFAEALRKLVAWQKNSNLSTRGLEEFLAYADRGYHYPGLGTIKKLSIMHHLELMANYVQF